MVRQCAWCLHLIDDEGERVSALPFPKLYEASHGICGVCGTEWMAQVLMSCEGVQPIVLQSNEEPQGEHEEVPLPEEVQSKSSLSTITALILELQRKEAQPEKPKRLRPSRSGFKL